jgi:hypothetical protein
LSLQKIAEGKAQAATAAKVKAQSDSDAAEQALTAELERRANEATDARNAAEANQASWTG